MGRLEINTNATPDMGKTTSNAFTKHESGFEGVICESPINDESIWEEVEENKPRADNGR